MCNRYYNFLEKKKSYSHSNLVFDKKCSTTHALIHLTDKIRHNIDKGGIFVNFRKASDIVDHHTLMKKLKYYGLRGISNGFLRILVTESSLF